MSADTDRARIIAPPPLLGLGCIGLALLARHFFPLQLVAEKNWVQVTVGTMLIGISIVTVVLARQGFIAHGTHPNPYRPTQALVSSGVYAFSRNPIYLAFLLLLVALALLANSWWLIIFDLVLFIVFHFGVVKREESYLRKKFGDAYELYCSRVRRWL